MEHEAEFWDPDESIHWAHEMQEPEEELDLSESLLQHALSNCTDNDCEIHNIVAAAEELVIDENNLAYWIAGAQFAEAHSRGEAAMELARALMAMRTTEARMDAEAEKKDEALNPGQGE